MPTPDPVVLDDLIARLEAATGRDLKLEADFDVALFGGETVWKTANYTMEQYPVTKRSSPCHVGGFAREPVPSVTFSMDASLSAITRKLPDYDIEVYIDRPTKLTTVVLEWPAGITRRAHRVQPTGQHAEPSIAACLALLRALRQETSHAE